MSTVNLRQPANDKGLALNAPEWAEHAFRRFVEAVRLRRLYWKSVDEMRQLDDRTLADLGIARCDIQRIAREATYGRA